MQALHLDLAPGRRFALWWRPDGPVRRLVVHAHAFAEEMNKSRRMVALQARALVADGAAVLVPDLHGCGDSEGEFVDARWSIWIDDLLSACAWGRRELARSGSAGPGLECWLWGHRLGALIATAAIARSDEAFNLLLWQPAVQGRMTSQQFLRLDGAAGLIGRSGADGRPSAKALLAAGQPARIAGYEVSPELMQSIAAAQLDPPERPGRLVWIDVAADLTVPSSPVVQTALQAWRSAGWRTTHERVEGAPFWQTTEIECVPALLECTRRALAAPAAEDAR